MAKTETGLKYSTQITACKTSKWLIEAIDLLIPTSKEFAPILHQGTEPRKTDSGGKAKSRIRLNIVDYSKGTGEKKVSVYANLAPERIHYLYLACRACIAFQLLGRSCAFEWSEEKLLSHNTTDGRAPVNKIRVTRDNQPGSDGKPRNNPWTVSILNGTGIPQTSQKGGVYVKRDSFTETGRAAAYFSDYSLFAFLQRCTDYLRVWENQVGGQLVAEYMQLKKAAYIHKEFYDNGVIPEGWNPEDFLPADTAA